MSLFTTASVLGLVLVVLTAAVQRGREYATFVGVMLALHTAVSSAIAPFSGRAFPLYCALQLAVYLHFLLLSRPRMRPRPYRALISLPASWFVAAVFLSAPWAIASGLGFHPRAVWLPFALALVGFLDSMFAREEIVDIALDRTGSDRLRRFAHGTARETRPLRIVQITDPHLGPFMSEARLRRICERAVARDPDLVLLTGDFLTMESQRDPDILFRALEPLRAMRGRTFACMGNHDHEAPGIVTSGLERAGVSLLIDRTAVVETGAGSVEILGFDFKWRDRAEHLTRVCAENPRADDRLRIAMLHDPGAFKHLPAGAADLVLSGHTHGGQLGLLRLGLAHTIISALSSVPDHGLWARGTDRLYVHRGTGHYGFPIRLGVPSEQSLLQVHRVAREVPALKG